jgi:hypothetical protein
MLVDRLALEPLAFGPDGRRPAASGHTGKVADSRQSMALSAHTSRPSVDYSAVFLGK